jgi:hypothetical protein
LLQSKTMMLLNSIGDMILLRVLHVADKS